MPDTPEFSGETPEFPQVATWSVGGTNAAPAGNLVCTNCYRQFRLSSTAGLTRACSRCPMCATCVRESNHRHCPGCADLLSSYDWFCHGCRRGECCEEPCNGCFTATCTRCCSVAGDHEEEEGQLSSFAIQSASSREYPPARPLEPPYKPFLYLGVELEMVIESGAVDGAARGIHKAHPEHFLIKYDGSVSRGFEAVTGKMSLEAHQEFWPLVVPTMIDTSARSWEHKSTGLHVHVSRDWFTPLTINKLEVFLNSPKTRSQIVKLAGRESPDFAALSHKKMGIQVTQQWEARLYRSATGGGWSGFKLDARGNWVTISRGPTPDRGLYDYGITPPNVSSATFVINGAHWPPEAIAKLVKDGLLRRTTQPLWNATRRYDALNLINPETLEFRLFKGTLNLKHILADIEFCHAASNWVRETSITNIESWPDFWRWTLLQGKQPQKSTVDPPAGRRSHHPYEHLIEYVSSRVNRNEEAA